MHFQWTENADGVRNQGAAILEALQEANKAERAARDLPTAESVRLCVEQLTRSYQPKMGGFGKAPKFPQPGNCLHVHFCLKRPLCCYMYM